MSGSGKNMVLVIGIDGCPWDYLLPLLEAGRLPNLARLMGQGSYGILRSTVPPLSPVAWSSFVTGRRPERHGIFDFWHPEDEGFRPALASDRAGAPFWRQLNRAGIGCGVVNIPLSHPPEPMEGFLISGFDAPPTPKQKVYPESLHAELRATYGAAVLEAPGAAQAQRDPEGFFAAYKEHDRLQTRAAIDLANKLGLKTIAINLMFNDHLSHLMADFSYVQRGLEVSDANIGRFCRAFPEASVMVISDHGSSRTRGTFLLFDWLLREGLIKLDPRRAAARRLNTALGAMLKKRWGMRGLAEKGLRHSLLSLLSLLPVGLQEAMIERVATGEDFYWPWSVIDRAASAVAMCSPAIGGFYLKTQGGHNIEAAELARRLAELQDSTGAAVFSEINRREQVYGNGLSPLAPQLMGSSALNLYTSARIKQSGPLTVNNAAVAYYGNHTPEGIYILWGAEFAEGWREPLHIWDVPAMVLRLHGLPIPADYERTLPEGVLLRPLEHEAGGTEAEAREGGGKMSAEDMAAVTERLKSLGYM